jgi:hypothetical protein
MRCGCWVVAVLWWAAGMGCGPAATPSTAMLSTAQPDARRPHAEAVPLPPMAPLPELEPASSLEIELLWAQREGWMTTSSFLSGLRRLPDDSFVIGGQVNGTLVLNRGGDNPVKLEGGTKSLGSHSVNRRPWLARYDSDRNLLWARSIAGNHISNIEVLTDGSIAVTGITEQQSQLEGSKAFGKGTARETRVPDCDPAFEKYRELVPDETWYPTGGSAHMREAGPRCRMWFVALYDIDGEFQWVRTGHAQIQRSHPFARALPDGSLVVVASFGGLALLDAGTGSERHLKLPLGREWRHTVEDPIPFLIRYRRDGSISWIRQLTPVDTMLDIGEVIALDGGNIALVGWRGQVIGTTDRSSYLRFPPKFLVRVVDSEGKRRWEKAFDIPPETFQGGNPADVQRFPNGDLLLTYSYSFRGSTSVAQGGKVLHQTTAPGTVRAEAPFASARVRYALRVGAHGRLRWLVSTAQAQRDSGGASLPPTTVMHDGSWLLAGSGRKGDTEFVVAPGQPGSWRSDGQADFFVARFFPDGRLDKVFVRPEFPKGARLPSRTPQPDGSYFSLTEDWTVKRRVPHVALSKQRIAFVP